MSEDPSSSPPLRASDADRDRVIDLLRAAATDGRLDPSEFDERVEAALEARTHAALAPLTADLAAGPAGPATVARRSPAAAALPEVAAERQVIREKHGVVRREGRWALPHTLVVRTAWSGVVLDLTEAVPAGPELVVELRVRGGGVEIVLGPGMVADANGLSARFAGIELPRDLAEGTAQTLHVRIVGRIKHGGVTVRRGTSGK